MSSSKKVTYNMIDSATKYDGTVEVAVSDNIVLTVKKTISFNDAMAFMNDVVDACVDIDSGKYTPEFFDFAIRLGVLGYYAGVQIPKDVSKAYRVLYDTDLFNKVCDVINYCQVDDITESARKNIMHKRNIIENANSMRANELVAKLDDMIGESNKMIDDINKPEVLEAIGKYMPMLSDVKAE